MDYLDLHIPYLPHRKSTFLVAIYQAVQVSLRTSNDSHTSNTTVTTFDDNDYVNSSYDILVYLSKTIISTFESFCISCPSYNIKSFNVINSQEKKSVSFARSVWWAWQLQFKAIKSF